MNTAPKICAYYSQGPHYERMLNALRTAYPEGHIVAMTPPGFPVSDAVRAVADSLVETELSHYSPRQFAACRRLLGSIRGERFDLFAVMFDSEQLRLVAALSGTPHCVHGTMDGRLVPLPSSVATALFGMTGRRLWGHTVYSLVWLAVHLLPSRADRGGSTRR